MVQYNVDLTGKTILVTGAAGFIGSNLAFRLLKEVKNVKVVGIDNMNDYYDVHIKEERLRRLQEFDGFTMVYGSIADKAVMDKLFEEHQPKVVVNLAAQAGVRYSITNPDAYVQSNLIGFYNILEACRHHEVEHLVYASSSSVYGSNKKVPYSTDDKVDNPVSLYAATKKSNELNGSETNGLQNYDDLYADVLRWVNNGWIDYCVPQLYWQIGHPAADYATLIKWWNKHAGKRPLYIGEDVERTVKFPDLQNPKINQMPAKYALHKQMNNVEGTVLWYAKAAVDNIGNYGTLLRTSYWRNPALQPLMPFIDDKAPKKPRKLKPVWTEDGLVLFWTAPKGKGWKDEAHKYVVYRFDKGEKVNTNSENHIIAITSDTFLKLPYNDGKKKYTYVVTALDRMSNESKAVKKKIKL